MMAVDIVRRLVEGEGEVEDLPITLSFHTHNMTSFNKPADFVVQPSLRILERIFSILRLCSSK